MVYEAMNTLLHYLIYMFGFIINIYMVASREFVHNIEELKQMFPKFRDELWASVLTTKFGKP